MRLQRTLTVLMADMKGFASRTSQQSREETVGLVDELRQLFVPVLSAHGGQLVKTTGDGFLLTFDSPTNAVLAGVAVQELLHRRNTNHRQLPPIELRIAVHTGEVTVEDGDVIGEVVNIAARVQELAEPGTVVLTESTSLAMNATECRTEPIGVRMLRGIPRPVRLYRALPPGARRRWRRPRLRWIVVAVLSVLLLRWLTTPKAPTPEPSPADAIVEVPTDPAVDPSAEPPPEPSADPVDQSLEPPPASDADTAALIQQTLQGFQQSLEVLEVELRQADGQLFDWSRELFNLESRTGRLAGALTEVGRSLPQTRDRHTVAVQRLVELANGREDRATADQLWRELGQYEAAIGQIEAQVAGSLPAMEASRAALRAWDTWVSDWSKQLSTLRQTRTDRLAEVTALTSLAAWDARLDVLGPELEQLTAQTTELRQAMAGLRAELDAQLPMADAAEQLLRSWEEFRDQWRAYLYYAH
jgi:class 3 adenylate cyclase